MGTRSISKKEWNEHEIWYNAWKAKIEADKNTPLREKQNLERYGERLAQIEKNGYREVIDTWGQEPKSRRGRATVKSAYLGLVRFTPRSHRRAKCGHCGTMILAGEPKYIVSKTRFLKKSQSFWKTETSYHKRCHHEREEEYEVKKEREQQELEAKRPSHNRGISPGRNRRVQALTPEQQQQRLALLRKGSVYKARGKQHPTMVQLHTLVAIVKELKELGGVPPGWEEEVWGLARKLIGSTTEPAGVDPVVFVKMVAAESSGVLPTQHPKQQTVAVIPLVVSASKTRSGTRAQSLYSR